MRVRSIIVGFCLLLSLTACDEGTIRLSAGGDASPTFKVDGSEALYSFWVQQYDPNTRERVGDMLWLFEKRAAAPSALRLRQVGEFSYGSLPSEAYEQRVPRGGERPRPLEEGKWYKAEVFTGEKDAYQVTFRIMSGRVSDANMTRIDENNRR